MSAPNRVDLPDAAASERLGVALAEAIREGCLAEAAIASSLPDGTAPSDRGFTIHLRGELGAGKTTIVRALLRRLGVAGRIKSPTFALMEPYALDLPKSLESRQSLKLDCYHFDFYRFEDPHAWIDAGFRDLFAADALRLVEWPERASDARGSLLPLPDVDLALALAVVGDGRAATFDGFTARGRAWMKGLVEAPDAGASSAAG